MFSIKNNKLKIIEFYENNFEVLFLVQCIQKIQYIIVYKITSVGNKVQCRKQKKNCIHIQRFALFLIGGRKDLNGLIKKYNYDYTFK
jgi:hypothetical protein